LATPAAITARRARRLATSATLALVALLLTAAAAARVLSRRFLFPGDRVALGRRPADARPRTFTARDGATVHALQFDGPPGAPVVVCFHNNRSTAEDQAELARGLRALGLSVLVVEYRGYGASRGDGETSEQGLYLDAEAALDGLVAQGIARDRVALWGTSLGTGVAAEMARRGRGAALVLVTPYTSIPDLVTDVVPLVPARALLQDHFDTLSKAREIRIPTLVVHGDADEVVPFWMGAQIARAIAGARLLRVPQGRHGDLFARAREAILQATARTVQAGCAVAAARARDGQQGAAPTL
jgi:fermentation-respiration switch protein FrsA (DUF1100 family)